MQKSNAAEYSEFGDWRDVPGFSRKDVQISSLGWVRTKTKGGKIRCLGEPKKGYLTRQGRRRVHIGDKLFFVHSLVMMAFPKPRPVGADTIDHEDQNPDNNAESNLRWATRKTQRLNQGVRCRNRTAKPVVLKRGDEELYFESILDAARELRVNRRNIAQAVKKGCRVGGWKATLCPKEDQNDMNGEVWTTCSLDSALRLSNMGRIQRKNDVGSSWALRFTPTPLDKDCYVHMRLRTGSQLLHRLIKVEFHGIDADPTKTDVDHIDRNSSNNRLDNLRWVSSAENNANRQLCMQGKRA
jgi:hypothetical protein